MVIFLFCLLLLFPVTAGLQTATPNLHIAIFKAYDSGNYDKAAGLLEKLKQEDSSRYKSLPYGLIHAHTLVLLKKEHEAVSIYENLASDKRLAPYVLLPLARISAKNGNPNSAIHYYQEYLSHPYPEYNVVAQEALDYVWQLKNGELLYSIARVVRDRSTLDRLAQLYLGRASVLRNDRVQAKNLFLSLIAYKKKDDVTSLALSELDSLEGTPATELEKERRGRLAYDVWNFPLARKYLEPVATRNMEAGYYYARTLFFLGEYENSRKAFQVALGLWPDDPMYSQALYQYANVYLREGIYDKAAQLYDQLRNVAKGELRDTAAFKQAYALRAQGRLKEALQAVASHITSRNLTLRGQALLLRGRIHFQTGNYKDALAQFEQTLHLRPYRRSREALLWKGMALEKLNRASQARIIYANLADEHDFFSHHAREKLQDRESRAKSGRNPFHVRLPQLPDGSQEQRINSEYASGDVMPAFLYLRLYEEAALLLPEIDAQTWQILGVDRNNRLERFLTISYLAALGGNYSTSTYYSEIFLKNLPANISLFSLSHDVLRTLFPLPYRSEIERFARERQLDPYLVTSIMKQESKFKRFARSRTFARGLMQIIPSTAASLADSLGLQDFTPDLLYVPEVNINLGTRYVQEIIKEFGSEVELIAAGYNGGESNVRRWLDGSFREEIMDFVSSIDFKETKNYVMIVRTNYELYRRIYGVQSASGPTESSLKQ